MKIIFITQNDVFYLGKSFDYLFSNFPDHSKIIGVIISGFSPFGKPKSIIKRIIRSYNVFGLKFFLRYAFKYIYATIFSRKYLIRNILKKYRINEIRLPNKNLNSLESINYIKSLEPDLIISISSNQIFKKQLIEIPKLGCLNLHTALLPQYKGLMPVFWALKNNESKIGITLFFMDEGIDTGDILIQKTILIEKEDTLEKLIIKTKNIGMNLILEGINMLHSGNFQRIKQIGNGKYYSFPTKKDIKEFLKNGKRFW